MQEMERAAASLKAARNIVFLPALGFPPRAASLRFVMSSLGFGPNKIRSN